MQDKIRRGLNELINKQGKDKFVIYPFGTYGKITKRILNEEFHVQELYVVDKNKDVEGIRIEDIDKLKEDYKKKEFDILLAVDPICWDTSLSIHRDLMTFADIERISDILSYSPYFTQWEHFSKINYLSKTKVAPLECIAREIYRNHITGSVAEAGVFQGDTARFINYLFPDRALYLFDTFEGFNQQDQYNDDERDLFNLKIDYSGTSQELVLKKMHYPQKCIIKKGWFPESTKDVDEKFALVRLDMDLYDPIYSGLEFFYPKMEKGGYIVVHDCRSRNFDGARKALIDFCQKYNLGYMCMPDNLGSAIICVGM